MHYGLIKPLDIADGEGIRVTLFVSGCRNHCKNCFQPQTWDFSYGNLFTQDTVQEILNALKPDHISGLTLLGGEPFEPENQRELVCLLKEVKRNYPNKSVWSYSGYTLEEILSDQHPSCEVTREFLSMIDVLVDGRFVEELKNISLKFRGSENQRIIDVQESLKKQTIVLYDI